MHINMRQVLLGQPAILYDLFLDEAVTSSPAKTGTRDCKVVNKTGHNYTLHSCNILAKTTIFVLKGH